MASAICEYHSTTTEWYNQSVYELMKGNLSDGSPATTTTTTTAPTTGVTTTDATTGVTTTDATPLLIPEIERILLTRVVIAICAFGVIGNILTLGLLLHRRWQISRRRKSSEGNSVARADILGLICLSLSDLLFCVSILPHAATEMDRYTYATPTFTLYFSMIEHGVINTFIMTSTWLTVSMTINRYAHLCHPILGLRYFGSSFMTVAIAMSVVFSIGFNLPRYWSYTIDHAPCFDTQTFRIFNVYALAKGPLKNNETAEAVYEWVYFFIGILIPLCVLAYCNCRIIHAVYNSVAVEQRRNKERNLITKILICIVIFYLLLVSPAEIIKFFSSKITISQDHMQTYNLAVTVLNTFQAVNFSCNFIPYMVLDKKFRQLLASLCRNGKKSQRTAYVEGQRSQCGSRYVSVTNNTCDTMAMDSCLSAPFNCTQVNLKKQYG